MLLVIASRADTQAERMCAEAGRHGALRLTCRDLSEPAWSFAPDDPARATGTASGCRFALSDVEGVLTLVPAIFARELVQIEPPDRGYVAAEMTAFLLCWLASLSCPVLNRPTGECLSGPGWRLEQWLRLAEAIDIPVRPWARANAGLLRAPRARRGRVVTVIGDRVLGPRTLARWALALAGAAEVGLLSLWFVREDGHERLAGVTTFPSLRSARLRRGILEHLGTRARA